MRVIDVRDANRPTITKQLDHLNILVMDAMPGDSLFLHCRSFSSFQSFPDPFNFQSLDMADKYPTWTGTKQTA